MISSPCIGRCQIDDQLNLCSGCARSGAEIATWREATPEFRRQVWAALPERRKKLGLNLHRLDWDREALRAFIAESLRPGGTWTAGVPGALAKFCISPGEPCEIEAKADSIRAFTARGAIAFDLSDHIRAFSIQSDAGRDLIVLATPRGRARSFLAAGLAQIGPDRDAIRAHDSGEILYDFGLNRASSGFGVRTASLRLIARLDGVAGLDWRQFLPLIGDELQEVSPTRVVRHSIGRIEVFTTIPPPDGASSEGPHTHFLPAFLAEEREAPAPIDLPEAYIACAIYHPPRPDGNP
ncbi:DUF1289 domain-containing protein [Rhodoblastus sp.]|uniref:DUF1289 domain-containing protein n=1 Tax=Rhodoblastus sp. TaxID=1962975 RepID=UPI0035B23823